MQAGLLSPEIAWIETPTLSFQAEGFTGWRRFRESLAGSRGVGEPGHVRDLFMRENREIRSLPVVLVDASSGMVRGVVVQHRRAVRGTFRR